MKFSKIQTESISGYVGGACGIAATHPLDTVRVQLQSFSAKSQSKIAVVDICKNIVKNGGPLGFFRGIVPPIVFRGLGMCISRTVYGLANEKYPTGNKFLRSFAVGATAGSISGGIETPVHLLKVRAQVGAAENIKETLYGYWKLAKHIIQTEGVLRLYHGVQPQMVASAFGGGMYYVAYDELRTREYNPFVAGCVSAIVGWPWAYPFDVIRTRLQSQPIKNSIDAAYYTFRAESQRMVSQHFTKWFPGLSLTLIRAAPRWGIVMYMHETTRTFLRKGHQV